MANQLQTCKNDLQTIKINYHWNDDTTSIHCYLQKNVDIMFHYFSKVLSLEVDRTFVDVQATLVESDI